MKVYTLIAGPNGSGKTTLYQTSTALRDLPRVNTDEIVREFGDWRNPADVARAGKVAVKQIRDFFQKGVSFNQETTLCGKTIIRNVKYAKELGYEIELHYVYVESVDILKSRIQHRVEAGGHGISEQDIERRYVESLQAFPLVAELSDRIILYDNSSKFRRIAMYEHGEMRFLCENVPQWFLNLTNTMV